MPRRALPLLLLLAAVLVGLWAWTRGGSRSVTAPTYVERSACVGCHGEQHAAWQASHHDLGFDHATETTVRGDFDDATFENHGVTSRFFRRDGRFFVNTQGADGRLADFEILYVIGYEPLQQYLIDVGAGRLQCLQVSWDTEQERWYHIQAERIGPDDPLHWTGMQFNANSMCIECHVTGYERGYRPETNGYASTWHAIDVGCQTCHGPGSNHVAWAARPSDDDPTKGLAVRLKGAPSLAEIDTCARCHARRTLVSDHHGQGEPLLDHMAPRLLVEPLYHADGQILDEVYVYGSFLQARKFERGVRCSDCHDPHTARLRFEGNTMCVQCHQETPPERFPTLRRAAYDTPAHHFHAPGTAGAQCVSCHAPTRTYMGNDDRHDHSFRVPRPDLTMRIGTPNACNGCHDDRSPAWALEEIVKRFPLYRTGRVEKQHYGVVFAAARRGETAALAPLGRLAQEQGEAAIVRATAVHYLERQEPSAAVRAIAPALVDPDGLVRATAAESIGRLVPDEAPAGLHQQKVHVLERLLDDPIRYVRSAVARALAGPAEAQLPESLRPAFERALAEWIATQEAQADRPGPHLNLGVLHEARRQPAEAEAAYRRALELDPLFAPARFNLSRLLASRGRLPEAAAVLTTRVEQAAEDGEAWYALGLVRAEQEDMSAAADALARAARLMPDRPRVRYNLALALLQSGDAETALRELVRAHADAPEDATILQALIQQHVAREAWDLARPLVDKLARLRPGDRRLQQAVRELRALLPPSGD